MQCDPTRQCNIKTTLGTTATSDEKFRNLQSSTETFNFQYEYVIFLQYAVFSRFQAAVCIFNYATCRWRQKRNLSAPKSSNSIRIHYLWRNWIQLVRKFQPPLYLPAIRAKLQFQLIFDIYSSIIINILTKPFFVHLRSFAISRSGIAWTTTFSMGRLNQRFNNWNCIYFSLGTIM